MAPTAYNERKEHPRYELIRGEEKLLAQPSINHATVFKNVFGILLNYLRGKRCKLFGEVDVFFDEENHLVPDMIVVCDRDKIKYNGIHGAPDLVVEILSPSTAKYDRNHKKDVYEQFGVREYWLISPKERSLEVYHHRDGKFVFDDVYQDFAPEDWEMLDDKEKSQQKFNVKVSLYDDLEINVKDIFEDV